MKKISNNSGIEIISSGFNRRDNTVDYTINIPMSAISEAVALFPNIQGQFILSGNKFIYGASISVPNLVDMLQGFKCEQGDVGKDGLQLSNDTGTSILFYANSLNLILENWNLNE